MVGIGGIGMSALAQLYHAQGHTVSGSDREESPVTALLREKGISVSIGEDVQHIPEGIHTLVFSDAVPEENSERTYAREHSIPEYSYFDAVGALSKERFTIAVAGSHGKTTTAAMIVKILHDAGHVPTALIGSLVKDFGSNFLEGSDQGPFVVEACEYKDHILKLSPNVLVVTNLEWDHTDYFTSFEQLKETFITSIQSLPQDGALVLNLTSDIGKELAEYAPCMVVDYTQVNIPALSLIGKFNESNAQAAKTVSAIIAEELEENSIDTSLTSFEGSWRRFEYIGAMPNGAAVYDDYAHHPTEIKATLRAVRDIHKDKKIIVAFHPHLYSRTHDLMSEFSTAFEDADEVIVAPIYPAREEPIEGVTNESLAKAITEQGTKATHGTFDEVAQHFKERDESDVVLITMGAGDIYKVAQQLVKQS